jgi:uncharacterized membrane protein
VELQRRLPTAILPPTRFLYVFAAYLWHGICGTEALASLRWVSSLFSILLLVLTAGFAGRLGGWRIGLCVMALMVCAPTQIHMGSACSYSMAFSLLGDAKSLVAMGKFAATELCTMAGALWP